VQTSSDESPRRRRNPWWIPIWLGRAPPLSDAAMRMFGLAVLGTFFEAYDLSLLSSALKDIADSFGITSDAELAFELAKIRFGGFFAFALLPLADRLGRRRVFLGAIFGMSVGTLVTAFAQTVDQFVAAQVAARTFMLIGAAVGIVMVAEELPAEHRGWGIGMLGALGAFGHGLGALLFSMIELLPFGWRALYAVGAIPLLALPAMRRSLRETTRFAAHRAGTATAAGWFSWVRPLAALARSHPGRALLIGLAGFSLALGGISVFQFSSKFVRESHGWAPWQYALMIFVAGGIGIGGNVVAGWLGDRIGRRIVGFVALALYPAAGIAFYQGPETTVAVCFGLIVFLSNAGDVVIRAFASELFPTGQRGASAGWLTLLQTFGYITGLVLVGRGMKDGTDLPLAISMVALSVLVAAVCMLLLPESRGQELETLSHEAGAEPIPSSGATPVPSPGTRSSA
jgi:MFS family permease